MTLLNYPSNITKEIIRDDYMFSESRGVIWPNAYGKAALSAFKDKYGSNTLVPINCFICDSNKFTVFNEIDRYGLFYPTGICDHCGNVQQALYYDEGVLLDFYKNFYRDIYGELGPQKLFEVQRIPGERIYQYIPDVGGLKTVLEIGCGAGGLLSVFKEKGHHVLGLDFNDDYLNFASKLGIPVKSGSVECLSAEDQFDLIIVKHVLEHVVNPQAFLRQVRKHLKHDGVLYIEVPSLHAVEAGGWGGNLQYYFQNAHVTHFTVWSLRSLMERVGFVGIKATPYIYAVFQKSPENQVFYDQNRAVIGGLTRQLIKKIVQK